MTVMVVLAALPSVLAIAVPALRLRVDSPMAGAVVVGARGMAALFAAALAGQRFRRTGARIDFGVSLALCVLAASDLELMLGRTPAAFGSPAQLPYELVGAGLLVAATLAPDRPLSRRWRGVGLLLGAAVVCAVPVLSGLGPHAGTGGDDGLRIATCVLLAAGAMACAIGQRARQDELMPWLSAALALSALGQLQVLLGSAGPPTSFTWADFLAVAAAAAVLAGVMQASAGDHMRIARGAVADERRRIARDLHDGVAQEVAFIAANARYLVDTGDTERAELIAASAQRALDDSRGVIGALRRTSGLPLGASLAMQAEEFARRWGLRIELDIQDEVDVSPEKEHAILRIVGEALSNAARHADASTVQISMADRAGRLHVAVCDDGRGFDAQREDLAASGFGLRSMRERVELLGGDLELESRPGGGTRVEFAVS